MGKRRDIALVFSCPGQEEKRHKKPVYGRTGKNLEILLKYLKENNSSLKPYKDRYDFRITNASNRVHYKQKTGRTEELDSYLFTERNLSRLSKEILDIEIFVICFGKKAEKTIKKLLGSPKYQKVSFKPIYTMHLGNQSLNTIKVSPSIRNKTEHRLKRLAKQISKQMIK